MRAGRLSRVVSFSRKDVVRGSYGESTDTYVPVLETRGEIREVGGNRTLSNEEIFYSKSKELTIRYNNIVAESMRVDIDGQIYLITYIEVLGRNRGMRLSLEKINV